VGEGELLYLSRADVEAVALDMPAMIGLLETAFREKGEGRVEMPPKPGIHTQPDAFIHAMPAHIPGLHAAGIKWVSGYPGNQAKGLPYITGLLILNDEVTGLPYSVMDCTWITAYRTCAATAVSAKYLARPESETAGILASASRFVRPCTPQARIPAVSDSGRARYLAETAVAAPVR